MLKLSNGSCGCPCGEPQTDHCNLKAYEPPTNATFTSHWYFIDRAGRWAASHGLMLATSPKLSWRDHLRPTPRRTSPLRVMLQTSKRGAILQAGRPNWGGSYETRADRAGGWLTLEAERAAPMK